MDNPSDVNQILCFFFNVFLVYSYVYCDILETWFKNHGAQKQV